MINFDAHVPFFLAVVLPSPVVAMHGMFGKDCLRGK